MPCQHNSKYSGTAILMAFFITAVAAIITTAILTRQQIDITRTEVSMNASQAYLYVSGAEIWAQHLLMTDIYAKTNNEQIPLIDWPRKMPKQRLPNGGYVAATLLDAQSFFNINSLTDTTSQQGFIKLLSNVLPAVNNQTWQSLVNNINVWLTPQGQSSNVGLDEYYMNLASPYHTAHQSFTSISELRLIQGVTPKIYNAIAPYIIALPVSATTAGNNATNNSSTTNNNVNPDNINPNNYNQNNTNQDNTNSDNLNSGIINPDNPNSDQSNSNATSSYNAIPTDPSSPQYATVAFTTLSLADTGSLSTSTTSSDSTTTNTTGAITTSQTNSTNGSNSNGGTGLNINTASALLLTTISPNISLSQAEEIITQRNEQGGFKQVSDFNTIPSIQSAQSNTTNITTQSQYFLLRTDVILNQQKLTVFSLFKRVQNNNTNSSGSNASNQYQVFLIWHSIGTM